MTITTVILIIIPIGFLLLILLSNGLRALRTGKFPMKSGKEVQYINRSQQPYVFFKYIAAHLVAIFLCIVIIIAVCRRMGV